MATLSALLEHGRLKSGDGTAVACGRRSLTYAELDRLVESLAGTMQAAGIGHGDLVGTLVAHPLTYTCLNLAAGRIGAAVAGTDVRLTPRELTRLFGAIAPTALITDEVGSQAAADLVYRDHFVRRPWSGSDPLAVWLRTGRPAPAAAAVTPATPGTIDFSSGSTGVSKGIVRCHGNLFTEGASVARTLNITSDDVVLVATPLYHGYANAFMRATFYAGARLLLLEQFDLARVASALQDHGVTVLTGVPFLYQALTELSTRTPVRAPRLRLATSGGIALKPETAAAFSRMVGAPLLQLFGLNEGGIVAANVTASAAKPESVGPPIDGVTVEIRDDADRLLPAGESGEVVVIRAYPPQEYRGLPEESCRAFRQGRIYTGDIGHIDDEGCLYLTGRKKRMINVAGNKVNPVEVEEVLTGHPGIAEAVVVGCPDARLGEVVRAVIVPRQDLTVQAVIDYCRQHLAAYKVPRQVDFRTELPRSRIGKVLVGVLLSEEPS